LEEFFNFEGAGDEDLDEEEERMNPPLNPQPLLPAQLTSEDQVHPLIDHFNTRKVLWDLAHSQNTHQLLHRSMATEEVSIRNQFLEGTIKGVKTVGFVMQIHPSRLCDANDNGGI